ncbi:MAG: hypothetical protein AAGC60_17780 [Acidobacteriota bacterium]
MNCLTFTGRALALAFSILVAVGATAQPIDLSTWTAESGPSSETDPFDLPAWELSADGLSVLQLENTRATFFYSDFDLEAARVTAELRVDARLPQDDDFIGFVIGYDPGDRQNPAADVLILDWKRSDQTLANGATARAGLALSRTSRVMRRDEVFLHVDDPSEPDGAVTELARGLTLGSVGWETDRIYRFELEILPGSLRVFVDGQLEIDFAGFVDRGRFGCFNDSQPLMRCGNIEVEELAVPVAALDGWTDESYSFGNEAPGSWLLAADARSAEQLNRNDASIFYSDFTLVSDVVVAELVSVDNSDDDFIGFVLGFDPGETGDLGAEYLLIDWKQTTQSGSIGGEPFTADAGLAVSRVVGRPSVAELFGHDDLATAPDGGVVELARAANLGGVGWNVAARYVFTFEVTSTSLRIWVEDTTRGDGPRLEFDLEGDFSASAGRFGCFANSQPRVECGNVVRSSLD